MGDGRARDANHQGAVAQSIGPRVLPQEITADLPVDAKNLLLATTPLPTQAGDHRRHQRGGGLGLALAASGAKNALHGRATYTFRSDIGKRRRRVPSPIAAEEGRKAGGANRTTNRTGRRGLQHEEPTGSVIGAALKVHKAPGLRQANARNRSCDCLPTGHTRTSCLPGFLSGPLPLGTRKPFQGFPISGIVGPCLPSLC